MKIVQDQNKIRRLHAKLKRSLDKYKSEDLQVLTGHKGNSYYVDAAYSKELNIWWDIAGIVEGNSGERFWNAFGIGRPRENKLAHIICEINYPNGGINKRVAAAWVEENGEYVLIHSGKIGGGRKGIGKMPFQEKFSGSFVESPIPELSGKFTEIGNLNSPRLPHQIKFFIDEVARIKEEITSEKTPSAKKDVLLEKLKTTFDEEFSGTKQYSGRGGRITSNCDHGIVVRELKIILEKKGLKIANDQQRDLYIYNNTPKILTVFEIKTSITSQTLFTAIGQLLVNNARLSPLPKLVYVVPEKPNKKLLITLSKLDIITLVYNWKKDKPVFKNIDKIL